MVKLSPYDYLIVGTYLVTSVVLGVWFVRRGTKSSEAFFAGGGALPWWIAGSSLLVACFAADTPLWIGDIIYTRGLEGVWLYWAPGIGAAFFVILIAPLWKRSGVMTDIEFLEVRYSGRAASWMRLLNSAFYAVFASIMWMTLQTLSVATIVGAITGLEKWKCVVTTTLLAGSYSIASGLWGVAGSGAFQFVVTYVGSMVLAVYVLVYKTGGVQGLVTSIHQLQDRWPQGSELRIAPGLSPYGLPLMTLIALFGFRWIEQAGIGQYVAQRVIATKSPRHAAYAALIWAVGFFAIVPLPWIITVVSAKVVLPDLEDGQQAYPRMAMLLPVGLRGLLIASMLAAFMSTYSSLMNWGASYAINDFYRRFVNKHASERHYVRAGQLYMVPMALAAAGLAMYAGSLLNVIFVVYAVMCGYWTVAIARWIWWRVNAWSEVVGWVGSVFIALATALAPATNHWWESDKMEQYFGHRTITIMLSAMAMWLAATLLTKPTDEKRLDEFYRRVKPPGFWRPVRLRHPNVAGPSWGVVAVCWTVSLGAVYATLFGTLKLAFGDWQAGLALTALGVVCIALAVRQINALYAGEESPAPVPDRALGATPTAAQPLINADPSGASLSDTP